MRVIVIYDITTHKRGACEWIDGRWVNIRLRSVKAANTAANWKGNPEVVYDATVETGGTVYHKVSRPHLPPPPIKG